MIMPMKVQIFLVPNLEPLGEKVINHCAPLLAVASKVMGVVEASCFWVCWGLEHHSLSCDTTHGDPSWTSYIQVLGGEDNQFHDAGPTGIMQSPMDPWVLQANSHD